MKIENNIIKYYLRNTYFINGTAYAGKSTMCALLAEKYGMIHCKENYHTKHLDAIATADEQPSMYYLKTMNNWQEFVNRTPDEYEKWINQGTIDGIGFEIAELISLSSIGQRIIVDTNIPANILHEISDYHHVAMMISPQSMSVEKFFDRHDEDKQFLLEQINLSENPRATLENFKACIARINSQECYDAFANSGFFTFVRAYDNSDTRLNTLAALATHFQLDSIS